MEEEGITTQAYCQFLNEGAPSDSDHFYEHIGRGMEIKGCQILRLGTPGNYEYELDPSTRPTSLMLFLSQYDAKCYCQWKSASQKREDGIEMKEFLTPFTDSAIDPFLKSNLVTFCGVTSNVSYYKMNEPKAVAASEEGEYLFGFLVSILAGPVLERVPEERPADQLRSSESTLSIPFDVEETNQHHQITETHFSDHSLVESSIFSVSELPQELFHSSSGSHGIQLAHEAVQRTQLRPHKPSSTTIPNNSWIEKLGLHDPNLFGLYIKTSYLKSLDPAIKATCQKIFNRYKKHYRRDFPLPSHFFAVSSWEQLTNQDQQQLKQFFLEHTNLFANADWEAKLRQELMILEAGSYYEAKVMGRILKTHQERGSRGQEKLLQQEIPQEIGKINLKLEKFKEDAEAFSSLFQGDAELSKLILYETGATTEEFRGYIGQAAENLKHSRDIFVVLAKKQLNSALEEKKKENASFDKGPLPLNEEEEQALSSVGTSIQKEVHALSADDLYRYGMNFRYRGLAKQAEAMVIEYDYRCTLAEMRRGAEEPKYLREAVRKARCASSAFKQAVELRAKGPEYQKMSQAEEQCGEYYLTIAKAWAHSMTVTAKNLQEALNEANKASFAFKEAIELRAKGPEFQKSGQIEEQRGEYYLAIARGLAGNRKKREVEAFQKAIEATDCALRLLKEVKAISGLKAQSQNFQRMIACKEQEIKLQQIIVKTTQEKEQEIEFYLGKSRLYATEGKEAGDAFTFFDYLYSLDQTLWREVSEEEAKRRIQQESTEK